MNNKKVSILIIVICASALLFGIFSPKKNINRTNNENNTKNSYFPIKSINTYTPFKGERIIAIKLDGVISDGGSSSIFRDSTSSNAVLDQIIKATKDPSVKGILLKINSPGGTVAASQEIYQALMRARVKKPIVITMGDVAASGGYYIASAGNIIFANPGTLTGSIGVITSYLNFTDLLTKIGIKGITIKSGLYKDLGNTTRPITEKERKILQELLDTSYKQFIADVARGRKVTKEEIAKKAEGLIYTGEQAKRIGLVDQLGDYYKAQAYIQKLAKERFPELNKKYGKKDIPVEESWKSTSLIDSLLNASVKRINPTIEDNFLKKYSYSKFQPLWLLE